MRGTASGIGRILKEAARAKQIKDINVHDENLKYLDCRKEVMYIIPFNNVPPRNLKMCLVFFLCESQKEWHDVYLPSINFTELTGG